MRFFISLILSIVLLSGIAGAPMAAAQSERGISLQATYSSVVIPIDEGEVQISLTLTNTGTVGEDIRLSVTSAPEGWEYNFWSIYPEQAIRAIYLPAKEMDDKKYTLDLRFKASAPKLVASGDHKFTLQATSFDGSVQSSLVVGVNLSGEVTSFRSQEVQLIAESIVVRAEVGRDFEFLIHATNKSDKDRTFELETEAPPDWELFFTHGWRQEKITELLIEAEATEDVRITLTPSPDMEPGKYPREYPVIFRVKSGTVEESYDLRAVITATYELILTTPLDRPQLNATVTAGQVTNISLVMVNNGTAALEDISFTSSKPDGWTITFTPDKLVSLDAEAVREIEVAIEPGDKTIAGDYAISLRANSQQDSDNVDFRVTVETSTAWGWVGIAIVILVIAALLGIFARLRRR